MPKKTSNKTTDHEEIRRWVESRGGHPAYVRDTASREESSYRPGLLRIDFDEEPASREEEDLLERVSWDDFFEKFDEKKLAFAYQDRIKEGDESRYFQFVRREGAEKKVKGKHGPKKAKRKLH